MSWLLAQAAVPSDVCPDGNGVCTWLYEQTNSESLARFVDGIAGPIIEIALIVLLAVVVRRLLRRVVHRTAAQAKEGGSARMRQLAPSLLASSAAVRARKAQRIDAIEDVVNSILGVIVWLVALLMMLGSVSIDIGPLIAGAGILGVALGFGAQDLVKDFLSGLFMLAEDQFGIGDVIDAGEASGVVESISLRTVRVRDVTGTLWHIPNGEIRRVGNMSQDWARALLDIGVSYDADIDEAARIIKEVADGMAQDDEFKDDFLDEPEIWGVQNLGPDSVDIRVVIKTDPGDQWTVARELRRRIKYALDEAEISIPYPQRTVWLRSDGSEKG